MPFQDCNTVMDETEEIDHKIFIIEIVNTTEQTEVGN